jgi:hypothetical protein
MWALLQLGLGLGGFDLQQPHERRLVLLVERDKVEDAEPVTRRA